IHARVVDAIERLHSDRRTEHVERLAHHAHRGELRDKAVHYLRQAGSKAAARSALVAAKELFELAVDVLRALPENHETGEEAFDRGRDVGEVVRQVGEGRPLLDHLREAERLAERLKDDKRRGLVCVFMTTVRSTLDELDEAIETGNRALEIARRLGDLKLRILATSCLEQAYCYRGDYQHVIDVATDSVNAMPAHWLHEHLGLA